MRMMHISTNLILHEVWISTRLPIHGPRQSVWFRVQSAFAGQRFHLRMRITGAALLLT